MRPKILLFGLAAVVIVALVVLSLGDSLVVDLLWFSTLGYRQVFIITLGAQVAIFAMVWTVAFLAIWISGMIALRFNRERGRLHVLGRSHEMVEVNLPDLIRALGDRVPWKLLLLGGAAILALFAAQGEASSWSVYLKALHGVSFGVKEAAFGLDVGFYVFTLPLLQELRDLFLMILVLTAASTTAVYWARGSLDFRKSPPQITSACAAHLSVLLGIFFVQRTMSYWLARYALTLHTNGVVFGLRYVDHILWKPGLWLLVALSIVAAGLCLANLREHGLRLPVAAAVVVFGPALILNLLEPAIERLRVKPDELRVEQPYLARNIEMTRRAYRLDTVDVKPFEGVGELTPAALEQDATTIKNIRLWDPAPAYRHISPVAGNPSLLRLQERRYRPLLDRQQRDPGDALGTRTQHRPAGTQRTDLGQPTPQVHPRLWDRDEPGSRQGPGRPAAPVYQEHPAPIVSWHRDRSAGYLLRRGA